MSVNPTRKIVSVAGVTAIAASAALSFGGAAAVADSSAKQMREVCAKSVYVKERPGVIPVGSVTKGQQVQVTRLARPADTRTSWPSRATTPLVGGCPRGISVRRASTRSSRPLA